MNPITSIAVALCLGIGANAGAASFADVLATPAMASPLAPRSTINGLAHAGARIVAVGQRGHIVYSDDAGAHWRQAQVPVSSDLTAVHFASARHGWAVGHDGVVLHSADGGASWSLQLDGRVAARLALEHFIASGASAALVYDARAMVAAGPDRPFLSVWFEDEQHGYVVGAFNLIFHTADGGRSWQPWGERTDNPQLYHLNAIQAVGKQLYIAGEHGLVRKLSGDRFAALDTPYQGSYFGVTGGGDVVLVYGLRGNAMRSVDGGRSWQPSATGVRTGLTAALTQPDGSMVIVSQAGQVLRSVDGGASFAPLAGVKPGNAGAVLAAGPGTLVIGGARGLRTEELPPR